MVTMTIGGRPVSSARTFAVLSPATGEPVGYAPDCDEGQLDGAMSAAHVAFRSSWSEDADERRRVLRECARQMESAAQEIGRLTTAEQGMPLRAAVDMARRGAARLSGYADLEVPRLVVQDDADALVEVIRRPIGVIAAIKPWNVPISMAVNVIAPALRSGCTVVLKPSPYTPLATLRLAEVLRGVVPAGVLNVVSGGDDLGRWMVAHPIPRGVSFTGSIATGKKVNMTAAADLKRVLLELGGNDPAIVLDDVDPEEVAKEIFWRAFQNAGQICMAIKRVFVPDTLHQRVVDALAAKARAVRVGDGFAEQTEMGPVNNAAQFERISTMVAQALEGGATAAYGGHRGEGPGYFYPPTILSGLAEGTAVVDEEQFGPVLPVLSYRTVDEAVRRANATHYGLGASVWSADPGRAAAVAERIDAGTVWINTHGVISPHQPFAGHKWSGIGAENGIHSIHAYTDPQAIYRAREGRPQPAGP
jgi:acyl-CoA reductase-like NAD-dependent aldehyde dehydrogenase